MQARGGRFIFRHILLLTYYLSELSALADLTLTHLSPIHLTLLSLSTQ